MNPVPRADDFDPAATGDRHDVYAPRLPDTIEVIHPRPTGLLTLSDGPRCLGILRGVLAGLAFPRVPGTGDDFIRRYGPDANLGVEALTASRLRERTYWIGNALAKAGDGHDRTAIEATLVEARKAAEEAETTAADVRRVHSAWNAAFLAATAPFERAARIARAASSLSIGYALGAGPVSMLAWATLAFLLIGAGARIAFGLRFDGERAYDAKAVIYAERSHSAGMRAVEMYRRGLAPDVRQAAP